MNYKKWEIMEYIIISWDYAHELYSNVNTKINNWYQPYWGVFEGYKDMMDSNKWKKSICQVMVHYVK